MTLFSCYDLMSETISVLIFMRISIAFLKVFITRVKSSYSFWSFFPSRYNIIIFIRTCKQTLMNFVSINRRVRMIINQLSQWTLDPLTLILFSVKRFPFIWNFSQFFRRSKHREKCLPLLHWKLPPFDHYFD